MDKAASTKLSPKTRKRAENACRMTGLKISDLLRHGLEKVLEEVERTGGLQMRRKISP